MTFDVVISCGDSPADRGVAARLATKLRLLGGVRVFAPEHIGVQAAAGLEAALSVNDSSSMTDAIADAHRRAGMVAGQSSIPGGARRGLSIVRGAAARAARSRAPGTPTAALQGPSTASGGELSLWFILTQAADPYHGAFAPEQMRACADAAVAAVEGRVTEFLGCDEMLAATSVEGVVQVVRDIPASRVEGYEALAVDAAAANILELHAALTGQRT